MPAFSTSWNLHRHSDGEAMMEELLRMGVDTVELGHGLKISQIDGILKVFDRGDIRICSIHNFCPHPLDVRGDSPDCFQLTSRSDSERRRAVRLTVATIEMAERTGVGLVVMHGGRIRSQRHYSKALAFAEQGKIRTKEYGEFKIAAVRAREEAGEGAVSRLQDGLREILPYAEERNVILALENRERYEDVPSEREIPGILAEISSPCLAYWHDFGHARIKENLTFLDHKKWLMEIAPRMVGCHIHDVRWPNEDHQVPFTGEIQWEELIPLLPSGIPRVLEMSPYLSEETVAAGWKHWKERFGE